jgi:PAS domain S-box-containing protein
LDTVKNSDESAALLYRRIFDRCNDAICLIDPEWDRIIDANFRACSVLGYPREKLIAMRVSDVHPNVLFQLRSFVRSVYPNGKGWTDELTCLTSEGDVLPTEISASIARIGDRTLTIAVVRDISEPKPGETCRLTRAHYPQIHQVGPDRAIADSS